MVADANAPFGGSLGAAQAVIEPFQQVVAGDDLVLPGGGAVLKMASRSTGSGCSSRLWC